MCSLTWRATTARPSEEVIPRYLLGGAGDANIVLVQEETCSAEHRVERKVRDAIASANASKGKNELRKVWGLTLFHSDDVPYASDLSDLPDGFTPFKNKVGPGGCCSPRHPTHFDHSFLELITP